MKKDFDAVQMMRDIRDKLNAEYRKDPILREKRLEAIRKKYGIGKKVKNYTLAESHKEMLSEPEPPLYATDKPVKKKKKAGTKRKGEGRVE